MAHSSVQVPEDFLAGWDFQYPDDPHQNNSIDCGVFMLSFIDAATDDGGRVRSMVPGCVCCHCCASQRDLGAWAHRLFQSAHARQM